MTYRLDIDSATHFRNVVFPVPARPVRNIDFPVDLTYLSAVSNITSFSISTKGKKVNMLNAVIANIAILILITIMLLAGLTA